MSATTVTTIIDGGVRTSVRTAGSWPGFVCVDVWDQVAGTVLTLYIRDIHARRLVDQVSDALAGSEVTA